MTPIDQAEVAKMLETGGWWLRRAGTGGEETKPAQCFTEGGFVRELGRTIASAQTLHQLAGLEELNRTTVDRLPPPWPDMVKRQIAGRKAALAAKETTK